jgi:hypothetical protein
MLIVASRFRPQFLLAILLSSVAGFAQLTPDAPDAPASAAPAIPTPAVPTPAVPTPAIPTSLVQPALTSVQQSLAQLTIPRWKAPKEVREAQQSNADSIGRDLATTLPGLLSQPNAGSVPGAFAIYRNVDALYDVLLRISQTASFAAPSSQAAAIASSLRQLESARTQLGDAIQQASQQQDAQIAHLQASIRRQAVAPAPAAAENTVVDDGPPAAPPHHRKRKPAARPKPVPAQQPAATPAASSAPQ